MCLVPLIYFVVLLICTAVLQGTVEWLIVGIGVQNLLFWPSAKEGFFDV